MEFKKKITPASLSGGEEMDERIRQTSWDNTLPGASENGNDDVKKVTILIVGEKADKCSYIRSLLEIKYHIITAGNGMDALHTINQQHPALVLSDSRMPEMDGIQLLKKIKQHPSTFHIPVILLMEGAGEETTKEGWDKGADDYLLSPFSDKELIARVNLQIRISQKQQPIETQLSNVFLHAPVAMCIFRGANHVIEGANKKMLELWGKEAGQVINQPVLEALPDTAGLGLGALLDGIFQNGTRVELPEIPIQIIRNGAPEDTYVLFVYEALREEDGVISGIMGIAHEITEQVAARKKLEESESFNRTVLESSPDCVKVIDTEGRLQLMNINGMCTMEIDDFSTVKNKYWWNMWGEENVQMVMDSIKEVLGGNTVQFQAFCSTVKGTPKWWDVMVSPVMETGNNNKVTSIISISRDITKQREAALRLEESESRYHNMIYRSPSFIAIIKGEDRIITIANEAFLEIWARGKEVITKPYFQVLPELLEQGFGKILSDVYESGIPFHANEMGVNLLAFGKMEKKYLNFVLQPQHNATGEIEGVAIIGSEVTPQAEYNLRIKESEARFRTLADQIPMIVFIIEPNPEATVSYWNKSWHDYTGQTIEEALGSAWNGIIHPDDAGSLQEVYVPAFKNKEPFLLPAVRIKRSDGAYRWHLFKGNPRYLPNGVFLGFIGVAFDVHERKQAEEMIRYRKALLEAHNEASIDGIMLVDANGKIISYNRRFMEIWNMPKEMVDTKEYEVALAFAMKQLVHPQQFTEKINWLYTHSTQVTKDELEFKNGRIIERHGYPVKAEDGSFCAWSWTFRDVTEQKNYESRIRESEAHFRLLADLMPEKVMNADTEGNMIYYNQNWLDYTGLSFEELAGRGWGKMIHPDDVEATELRWQQSVDTGNDFEMEVRILNKEGQYKWHLSRAKAVKDDTGQIKIWIGVNTDIQHQKKQREALENAVAKRTIELQQANEELQHRNQDIALSKYNKRFLTEFSEKFSADKLHNEFFDSLVQFIAETTRLDYVFVGKLEQNSNEEFAVQTIALTAFGKLTENIHYSLPDGPCEQVICGTLYSYPKNCRILFPNNKTIKQFEVEGYLGYPLKDEKGIAVGLIAVMHGTAIKDPETVSSVLKIVARRGELELERIKQEEALIFQNEEKEKRTAELMIANKELIFQIEEKEKRAAELIIANKELKAFTYISSHDLQEPLRKIKTFGTLLAEKEIQHLSVKGKDYLTRMQHAAIRMQTLIEDLLAYSHVNITERKFENTCLDKIISEVINELAETIREKNATIDVNAGSEIPINPSQFRQLLHNLIGNALKFCKPGIPPHIIITSVITTGDKFQNEKLIPGKHYCLIRIADNGVGFDPQYKDRIFEVFQRLYGKDEYEGTGIGLAIVKKIIDNHNGIIEASGDLNKGATFDIYIPA